MTILTAILIYLFLGIGPTLYVHDETKKDPKYGPGFLPEGEITPYWFVTLMMMILWLPFLIGGIFEKVMDS